MARKCVMNEGGQDAVRHRSGVGSAKGCSLFACAWSALSLVRLPVFLSVTP